MPELPDVECWKRYIDATSLHQTIESVEVDAGRELKGVSARDLRNRLNGKSLEATRRHGKHLFARLGGDDWLRLHFGMTGRLQYARDDEPRPSHTRLTLRFPRGYRLAWDCRRRLGQIGLTRDPDSFVAENGLGPDALDAAVTKAIFRQLLADRRGTVKGALMDQGLIAGLGNIYADETLFQAKIHPRTEARDLDAKAAGRLYGSMHHVLRTAIDRQADPARLPRTWLLPHRHPGARCPRCGGSVEKITVSGRSTYLCRTCQRPA